MGRRKHSDPATSDASTATERRRTAGTATIEHAHPLHALQQQVGNQAIMRLAAPPATQTSAAMGEGGQSWVRPGDTGPVVQGIRDILNTAGTVGTPLPDGDRYDPAMIEVIRQFQTDNGLDPDSIIGPLTWEALDRHGASTPETVTAGTDHIGDADRPTPSELTEIGQAIDPTSSGPGGQAQDWDGRNDSAARDVLENEMLSAMQDHLDEQRDGMVAMEQARASGQVLSTNDQEGAGRAAKRSVDAQFGSLAAAGVLTRSQERARAAFNFTAGVNLLDASDTSVRRPDPVDLAEWIAETDEDSHKAQLGHHFDKNRRGQGEPGFFRRVIRKFVRAGANRADLSRYDRFGFAFADPGPKVLSQIALVGSADFSTTPAQPGGMSDAERRERWATWELLVHEYIHTLAHPEFNRSHGGKRVLFEGFCELFTREVLLTNGGVDDARADADPSLRQEIEGGDVPDFDARFVPDYAAGDYAGYLGRVDDIVGEVGMEAARAAFFLGHVELVGLEPGGRGEVIDPNAPDAARHLGPDKVVVPDVITSVNGLSILTGATVGDIVAANPGLSAAGPLPPEAGTTGLEVPGTSHHRVLTARSRSQRATETKADIAAQHGITVAALVRANPHLNHREPREGEWILIPVH